MDKFKIFLTTIFGALFSFFGLLTVPLILLVSANVIDYITGLMACPKRGEKINSYKSFEGIKKKITMYLLIVVGFMIDVLILYSIENLGFTFNFPTIISCIVAVWLICNEIISILENLVDIGTPLPKFLLPLIKLIKSTTETKIEILEGDEENDK